MKSKQKYLLLLFLLITIFLLFSCKKRNAYLFNNPYYYSVFSDKYQIYKTIRKKFNRNFFTVNEIGLNTLSSVNIELNTILNEQTEGVIFIQSGLSSLLFKKLHSAGTFSYPDMRILTYDIPREDMYLETKMPAFNVLIDHTVLSKKLVTLLENYSDATGDASDDLSNCSMIIDRDYSLCSNVVKYLRENGYKIEFYESPGNYKKVRNWVEKRKDRNIVFFGYRANSYILELDDYEHKKNVVVEVLTGFGEAAPLVDYRLDLNWNYAIDRAINSSEFNKFLEIKKKDKKKGDATDDVVTPDRNDSNESDKTFEIQHYIVDAGNAVRVHRYNRIGEVFTKMSKKIEAYKTKREKEKKEKKEKDGNKEDKNEDQEQMRDEK